MAEQWMSIVEYARTFAVSDMTIRRRIKTGKLHAVLKEGKYYIPVLVDGSNAATKNNATDSSQKNSGQNSSRHFSGPREVPTVIKGHPSAQRTHIAQTMPASRQSQMEAPSSEAFNDADFSSVDSQIPSSIRQNLAPQPTVLVETRGLLNICDQFLRRTSGHERRIEDSYRHQFSAMESTIRSKDLEIGHLKQQIEDFQLLIQILEKKSR